MTTPEQTLQALADLDPDYPAFAAALPPEISHSGAPLPEGLAEEVTALLRAERPELSVWLDARAAGRTDRLAVDPLAAAGVLTAIVFLLRSHIRIEGKHFSFIHEPEDVGLVKSVLEKLSSLLGGGA